MGKPLLKYNTPMHAFLVSSPPDISESVDTLHLRPETSIGISEVRQISVFLSRKPISHPVNTVIVFDAHLLTVPAQNAFLKTLEEPPANSVIYLVTSQPELLLPTIISRVEIVSDGHPENIDPEKLEKSSQLIEKLLKASGEGERLIIIQGQNFTRQSALEFLNHLEHLIHGQIKKGHQELNSSLLSLIFSTRMLLKSNVNLTLALGDFAIHLKAPLSD